MKNFITSLCLLLISASVFASNFPTTMGELYCVKQGNKEESCFDISLENAYCLGKYTALECREFKGPELCQRTTRSMQQCASKNKITGLCYLAGYTDSECVGITAAKLVCKSLGRTFDECKNITEAEVLCLHSGKTLADCAGVTPAQVLCLDKRNDMSYCKGAGKAD